MKPLRNLVQQGVDFLSPNQFRQPFPGDAFRSEMSAQHHADRRELARWFSCIPQVETLALNHGDRGAQEGFRGYYWEGRI